MDDTPPRAPEQRPESLVYDENSRIADPLPVPIRIEPQPTSEVRAIAYEREVQEFIENENSVGAPTEG